MKSILLIQPASPLAACSILKDLKSTGVAYKFLNSWHQIAVPCQTKKVAMMVCYIMKARHIGPQAVYSVTRQNKYTWPN